MVLVYNLVLEMKCFSLFIAFAFIKFMHCHKRADQCKEKTLEHNIEAADVILAGEIIKIDNSQNSHYSAFLKINRIIKGHNQVNEILKRNLDLIGTKSNAKYSKKIVKSMLNGNVLHAKKFGTSSVCDSSVKMQDTGIFLFAIDRLKNLVLNSSIIRSYVSSEPTSLAPYNNAENACECIFDKHVIAYIQFVYLYFEHISITLALRLSKISGEHLQLRRDVLAESREQSGQV